MTQRWQTQRARDPESRRALELRGAEPFAADNNGVWYRLQIETIPPIPHPTLWQLDAARGVIEGPPPHSCKLVVGQWRGSHEELQELLMDVLRFLQDRDGVDERPPLIVSRYTLARALGGMTIVGPAPLNVRLQLRNFEGPTSEVGGFMQSIVDRLNRE
jgi:hypothetical protein